MSLLLTEITAWTPEMWILNKKIHFNNVRVVTQADKKNKNASHNWHSVLNHILIGREEQRILPSPHVWILCLLILDPMNTKDILKQCILPQPPHAYSECPSASSLRTLNYHSLKMLLTRLDMCRGGQPSLVRNVALAYSSRAMRV